MGNGTFYRNGDKFWRMWHSNDTFSRIWRSNDTFSNVTFYRRDLSPRPIIDSSCIVEQRPSCHETSFMQHILNMLRPKFTSETRVNVSKSEVMLQWENVTAWVAEPPPRVYLQNADGWANRRTKEGTRTMNIELESEVGRFQLRNRIPWMSHRKGPINTEISGETSRLNFVHAMDSSWGQADM